MKPDRNHRELLPRNDAQLLDFLLDTFPVQSRTTVKSWLRHRIVTVNDTVTTLHSTPVGLGDRVCVRSGRGHKELRHPMLRIIYEDDHLIAIDKRNGLLSMGTEKEQRKTAYRILSEHVKHTDPSARIFILHRLDRETSGLMLFAKSEQVQQTLQRGWRELVRLRRYVAVVEGVVRDQEGVIDTFLADNKARKVYVSREEEGDRAVTRYRVLRRGRESTLMELELETGRKNQIRAHMEHIGHPVAGDLKYGGHTCNAGRVCLHAYMLHVTHPVTGKPLDFSTPIPQAFEREVGQDGGSLPASQKSP